VFRNGLDKGFTWVVEGDVITRLLIVQLGARYQAWQVRKTGVDPLRKILPVETLVAEQLSDYVIVRMELSLFLPYPPVECHTCGDENPGSVPLWNDFLLKSWFSGMIMGVETPISPVAMNAAAPAADH